MAGANRAGGQDEPEGLAKAVVAVNRIGFLGDDGVAECRRRSRPKARTGIVL